MLKRKKIIFTPIKNIEKEFYPVPSINNIPKWYKKQNSYIDSKNFKMINGSINLTIKKCIPVFDSMTAGYTIFTHKDIYVSFDQDGSSFFCPTINEDSVIQFHSPKQVDQHPFFNKMPCPKYTNPWSIKTPNGYSSLFIPPMHNPNDFLTILPGIVDTDTYFAPVNLPFFLNSPTFEGLIPAGTAICQVIPFKRDSFSMKILEKDNDIKKIHIFSEKYYARLLSNYKKRFWQKKYYK